VSRWSLVVSPVLLLAVAVSVRSQDSAGSRLPDGPGRTALLKACSPCHGAESAVGHLKTHDEWKKTLDEMAANGADATDEEWNQILGYLDKHYSLIFVNKAGASDLANALDVPQADGENVVRYRDEHGRFATIDDLRKIPGLDAAKIEARKDRFVF